MMTHPKKRKKNLKKASKMREVYKKIKATAYKKYRTQQKKREAYLKAAKKAYKIIKKARATKNGNKKRIRHHKIKR